MNECVKCVKAADCSVNTGKETVHLCYACWPEWHSEWLAKKSACALCGAAGAEIVNGVVVCPACRGLV